MKPITPLAGFNIRGVPVRLHVDTATPRRCTNHGVGTKRPLATKVVGARRYCPDCAEALLSFSRAKADGDSVQGGGVSLQREGDAACLAVRL